ELRLPELERAEAREAAAVLGIGGERRAIGLLGLGDLAEPGERLGADGRKIGGQAPFTLGRFVGERERFLRLALAQPGDRAEVDADGAAGGLGEDALALRLDLLPLRQLRPPPAPLACDVRGVLPC